MVEKKNPVSTPSKFKVCEFESLIRGQDNNLSTKVSALANIFLFISFLSESISYVGFCKSWYLGISCFVDDWVVSKSFCTQKQDRVQTAPFQDKFLMTGGVITFMSCYFFFECLFFASNSFVLETETLRFCHVMFFFVLCRFPFTRFRMHSQRYGRNSSGQHWTKWHLH